MRYPRASSSRSIGRTRRPTSGRSHAPCVPVEGGEHDFRCGRRIGGARLDTACGDQERDPAGRFRLRLEEPTRSVGVWMDESFPYVMAFTGGTLPEPAERRRSLGVEPMSCPPNALQTGRDIVRIASGERWHAAPGDGRRGPLTGQSRGDET